jgi:enoyl-CoA hydratase
MTTYLQTSRQHNNEILIVELNRPERSNAVNREMADGLCHVFIEFERDPVAKVAILTSSKGSTSFCAGADLKDVSQGNLNILQESSSMNGPMGPTRLRLSKPVIAAIKGHAVAGGLELACWCSLRLATRDAVFGVFCRRFGVPLIDGGTVRLPKLIGYSRAIDMILTGRPIDAKTAFDWGLVNRLVNNEEELMPEALSLARQLCAFPQTCMRSDYLSATEATFGKQDYDGEFQQMHGPMLNEFQRGIQVIQSGETIQGATRFALQKEGRHGHFDSKL